MAFQIARENAEAATSLLGLVSDLTHASALRAGVAIAAAGKDSATARRLLESLPPGETRTWSALQAAWAQLAAGATMEEAVTLASIGLDKDQARRWLLPEAARFGDADLQDEADKVGDPYWRSLGLVGVAHVLMNDEAKPRPAPERARMIRPIVEWEGI